eukprot:TRINITY_DN18975_c0_g1_i1.p1 TRINITY_DN18975_c0_g1~~TRINITY_DN18975_c0_g1_i1.p1  ORF type:complete len:100 (+),score=0.51 TRINITY_DN18975_c0_g1_i1:253-552(+)
MYTIAHASQQQTAVVMTKVVCSRFVDGPLLYNTRTSTQPRNPRAKNISVMVRNAAMALICENSSRLTLKLLSGSEQTSLKGASLLRREQDTRVCKVLEV